MILLTLGSTWHLARCHPMCLPVYNISLLSRSPVSSFSSLSWSSSPCAAHDTRLTVILTVFACTCHPSHHCHDVCLYLPSFSSLSCLPVPAILLITIMMFACTCHPSRHYHDVCLYLPSFSSLSWCLPVPAILLITIMMFACTCHPSHHYHVCLYLPSFSSLSWCLPVPAILLITVMMFACTCHPSHHCHDVCLYLPSFSSLSWCLPVPAILLITVMMFACTCHPSHHYHDPPHLVAHHHPNSVYLYITSLLSLSWPSSPCAARDTCRCPPAHPLARCRARCWLPGRRLCVCAALASLVTAALQSRYP